MLGVYYLSEVYMESTKEPVMDREEEKAGDSQITNKNIKLMIVFAAALVILALAVFIYMRGQSEPTNLLGYNQAREIVLEILRTDNDRDSIVAYLYPALLQAGDRVVGWDYDSREAGAADENEKQPKELERYTWLAWIDRDPGNVFFAHNTEFVYIDAVTGQYEKAADDFWPSVNGESFEGELTDMVATYDIAAAAGEDRLPWMNLSVEDIKKMFAIEAKASETQNKMRITPDEADAPPGEYYALIVSGFGKNAWVFLEGAHLMYDALLPLGYNDAHITFIAPYHKAIDPKWSHYGINAPLVDSDRVDTRTSPTNVSVALDDLKGKLTKNDSLFVFILAHGALRKFALGEPVSASEKMGAHDLRFGSPAEYGAARFADKLLKDTKACEVMVLFDSCHSGWHEEYLRARYDPEKVKRLQVAHSTNRDTISYGADYRKPRSTSTPAKLDLDSGAPGSLFVDPNPADRGGEFSSGFIENIGSGIFSTAYEAAIANDAARMNNFTHPYLWTLGESGPCTATATPPVTVTPEPPDTPPAPKDTPPAPEAKPKDETPAPEPAPKKKTVTVVEINGKLVPHAQLRAYPAFSCNCCEGEEDHYHALNGESVTALDGTVIPDPFKDCGYGTVSDLPARAIEIDE
jgi:hypothetical protein